MDKDDQSSADSKALAATEPFPIYIGCKLYDHKMTPLTPPMSFLEAYIWALTRKDDPLIGKRTSWGLFTFSSTAAEKMAFALGCQATPIWHQAHNEGYYNHYHVSGFSFLNCYKSFHVWYA